MEFNRIVTLRNGTQCWLRSGTEADAQAVIDNFNLTHGETDYLLTYPDENSFNVEQEGKFLKEKAESKNEVEILAVVNQTVVGTAGVDAVGTKFKLRHRAEFGVSVAEEYWGLGIGGALLDACVECARAAGFTQLELDVIADNSRAISMYRKAGFVEFGRNPRGFYSRTAGFQELVHMRLEL